MGQEASSVNPDRTSARELALHGGADEGHGVHEIEVRVRYPECDPMGVVHHTVYPVWFEMGRTEMLRAAGGNYRDLEAEGIFLAVVRLEVKYRRPARYDDVLRIRTTLRLPGPVKIEHAYEVRRGDELLVEGATTLACLDQDGRARQVPESLVLGGGRR